MTSAPAAPALSAEQIAALETLLAKATPQNFDTAESRDVGEVVCPWCDGDGYREAVTYTNYDAVAIGVQFFGIGPEHRDAEALIRALIPALPGLLTTARAALAAQAPAEVGEDYKAASRNTAAEIIDALYDQGIAREDAYRLIVAKLDEARAPRPSLDDAGQAVAWESLDAAGKPSGLFVRNRPPQPRHDHRWRPLYAHPPAPSAEAGRVGETDAIWRENLQSCHAAIRMIREWIEHRWVGAMPSEEQLLPEPGFEAEAIIAALDKHVPAEPTPLPSSQPVTRADLADALSCFWNATLGAERDEQRPIGCVVEGIAAIERRLRELDEMAALSGGAK